MPTITIHAPDGTRTQIEAAEDARLVRVIEEAGIAIGHRCGGKARCTTCRVEITSGEPDSYTAAEHDRLADADLLGSARLSCQIVCSNPMELRVLMTKGTEGWPDTGPAPAPVVQPEAAWFPLDELREGRAERRPDERRE